MAYRSIRSGEYTRKQLEEEGLILPSQRGKRNTAWRSKAVKAIKR